MCKRANEGEISGEKNKKLKKERSVNEAKIEIVNKTNKEGLLNK